MLPVLLFGLGALLIFGISGVFVFVFARGRAQRTAMADGFRNPEEIYKAWQNDSWIGKLLQVYTTLYFLVIIACLAFIIVVALGAEFGWKPIQNFINNLPAFENEEAVKPVFKKITQNFIGIFIIVELVGIAMQALRAYSYMEMSWWISRNQVDCYEPLRASGIRGCGFLVGNAYLIKERPNAKMIHLVQWVCMVATGVFMIVALSLFFRTLFEQILQIVNGGTSANAFLKGLFLSPSAILFYIACIASVAVRSAFERVLTGKINELLVATSQNRVNE